MSDFVYQLAIWLPTSMIAWMLVWRIFRTGAAFNERKLSTWPRSLVLAAAAIFGLIGGGVAFALGENMWGRLAAGVLAALVSVGLVPRLWAQFFPPALPSSDLGKGGASGDG
ncbi:MAG TPA: hypothetical protein VF051_00425 [Hyphomicrobiaceae bacterium]